MTYKIQHTKDIITMAHNINTYIGRNAAWHNLGTVTNKYQTTDELLADPGFQYVVFKSQLHDGLGAYYRYKLVMKSRLDLIQSSQ